jgi:hypothetical protein
MFWNDHDDVLLLLFQGLLMAPSAVVMMHSMLP